MKADLYRKLCKILNKALDSTLPSEDLFESKFDLNWWARKKT